MSNWVGGLPPEPKAKEDNKKAVKGGSKPASPVDEAHPKTFFGGAIPPVPPKLPKYKKDEPPPKVIIRGAGPPLVKSAPVSPQPPSPSPPTTPRPSSPPRPRPPPPLPPPPPPSPIYDSTPQSYSPPPPPKRIPSVFDKKPKKKKKKKKKPPPPPKRIEYCDDETCADPEGEGNLGNLPSIFTICHIPAIRQGLEMDHGGYGVKEDHSGQASPRSWEEDDGLDIPPEVPSYKRPDEFAGIFGKKIDARNIAELGPHGWHPKANAPYDITDTGDTVTVGPSGWHEPRSE